MFVIERFVFLPLGCHAAWQSWWEQWMSDPASEREFTTHGSCEAAGREHVREHGLIAFRIEKVFMQEHPEQGPATFPSPPADLSPSSPDGTTVRRPSGLIVPDDRLAVPQLVID